MTRLLLSTLLAAVVLSGCGGESDPEAKPEKSATPTVTYFVRSDTEAVNKVASKALAAGDVALNKKNITRCNKAASDGYPAWRRCWHALLDPLQTSLTGIATQFKATAGHDLPKACVTELEATAETFSGFAAKVDKLAAGIDSDDRAKQVQTGKVYYNTIRRIGDGYTKPFQELTKVCYSPSDLKSINASPKPTP